MSKKERLRAGTDLLAAECVCVWIKIGGKNHAGEVLKQLAERGVTHFVFLIPSSQREEDPRGAEALAAFSQQQSSRAAGNGEQPQEMQDEQFVNIFCSAGWPG